MEQFTLAEAAQRLGISKNAVRKRVQRGTLPHTKGADGHVYVYLDIDRRPEDDASADAELSSARTKGRRRLLDFAQVSAIFAVGAGTIYVLGLFALWVPIARTYTHDFTTAWHAASLVPRTMVAGLGVRQFVALPLLIVIVVLAWTLAAYGVVSALQRRRHKSNGTDTGEYTDDEARRETRERLIRTQMAVISLFWLGILYAAWRIATSPEPLFQGFQVSLWGIGLIIVMLLCTLGWVIMFGIVIFTPIREREVLGGLLVGGPILMVIFYFSWRALIGTEALSRYFSAINLNAAFNASIFVIAVYIAVMGGVFAALAMIAPFSDANAARQPWKPLIGTFVCAFVAAFMLTATSDPPLPTVNISANEETEGLLLAHTERFWYVFDTDGELIAIPDDEVKTVRVSPSNV